MCSLVQKLAHAHSVYACLCCFSSFWFRLHKEYERNVFQLKRYNEECDRYRLIHMFVSPKRLPAGIQLIPMQNNMHNKVITFIGQQVLLLRHYFVLVSWDYTYLHIESGCMLSACSAECSVVKIIKKVLCLVSFWVGSLTCNCEESCV